MSTYIVRTAANFCLMDQHGNISYVANLMTNPWLAPISRNSSNPSNRLKDPFCLGQDSFVMSFFGKLCERTMKSRLDCKVPGHIHLL